MRKSIVCLVGAVILAGGLIASARGRGSSSPIEGPKSGGCDSLLPHIATVRINCGGSDGPYWLGVDGSSNHLFVLSDSRCEGDNWGIHVYNLSDGGNNLIFDQTLFGSEGPSSECYGALTVSESTDRLFAIDYCSSTVDIYDTATLNFLGTVPVDRAGEDPLMVSVGHFSGAGGTLDDQIFISDGEMLRISDIATLNPIADHEVTLSTSGGEDDGHHMVVDTLGERIFVSDHDNPFIVFDFSSPPVQIFPTFGVDLCEPLGIAPLPDGKLLITDEDNCVGGLFRLNSDLSLDAAAEVPGDTSCSEYNPEGVVYDAVHERIYVADEDCDEIEVFGFCELECSGPEECDDKVACTVDECVEGMCIHTPDDALCDDGEACTTDQCADGGCLNRPIECPQGEICEDGECVPQAECKTSEDCDDGDACTTDECVAGECVNTEIECPQGEFCVDGQCQAEDDPCAPGPNGKVTICHIPPGNPGNAHTISVSRNALPAHLAHGDHCGPCEDDD